MLRITAFLLLALTVSLGRAAESGHLVVEITDSRTGQAVADAVVIVQNGPKGDPVSAVIAQKNRQFQPQTLVIPKNSTVEFPNLDNTQHHVYSFSPAKVFDLELYAGKPEEPVTFNQAGIVEIGCNIHDQMQGFIVVTDSALSGRTDGRGRLGLDIPPSVLETIEDGEIRLHVWHPRMVDNTRAAVFSAKYPFPDVLSFSLELSPEPAAVDPLDGLQRRFREL